MPARPRGRRVALLLAASAAGCAAVKPQADFPAVAADVQSRTGYAVHWHDGSPADQAADARVAALLAKPLDVHAAVEVALLNSRRLQATYERLGVAQADLVGAGLLRNPLFSGDYEFGEAGHSARIDLSLTFDFVDLLLIPTRKRSAAVAVEAAKAGVTGAVLDAVGDVQRAFYAAQAAEQAVGLRQQIAEAQAASADLAKRLRDAGNTTPLELAAEQSAAVDAQLELDRAQADATATRERLNTLLGASDGQTHWTFAGKLDAPTTPEPPRDAPATVDLERRGIAASVDLRQTRAAVAVRLSGLGVTQPLGLLSQLEAGVAAEKEDGLWYTGPSVSLPIPIFSQGQPAVAKVVAQVRAAEMEDYAEAVDIRSAVRLADARVRSLRQQVDLTRDQLLPLRKTVVDQTQLQYNAMQVGGFDLLTAKRQQIEAGATYLLLLRDYWTAQSELELILAGRLPRVAREADLNASAMPDAESEVPR